MRNVIFAAVLAATPALALAQATNPESSGAPASAQSNPYNSGSAQSMPQGAATMQNDTSTGQAGMTTNGNGTHHHHHHKMNSNSGAMPTSPTVTPGGTPQ